MPLTYQDCKELQEAGFPQEGLGGMHWNGTCFSTQYSEGLYQPSLSELIKECGGRCTYLWETVDGWVAGEGRKRGDWTMTSNDEQYQESEGTLPEQAVKNLYCAIMKK